MSFNNSFTAVTGATYTAAQYNTYVRDNFTAIWVGTTAGDIDYYSSATAKQRLAIGAANTVLKSNGSLPSWTHSPAIAGVLHTKNVVNFSPGGQSFSGAWADITGATLNLTTTIGCTVLVLASVVGYNATTGRLFYVRAVVNGVADASPSAITNGGEARNEALPYIHYQTGVGVGTFAVKLQCQADTDPNVVQGGRLMALALVE